MITVDVGHCLLKSILKQKKISQQELALATGINKQDISNYANDRRVMSLKTAKRISTALNCSMDVLYEWIIK